MDLPKYLEWEAIELHDYGGCGEVFLAHNAADEPVAMKCLEDLTVSRRLLEKMAERLEADGWPDGVVPLIVRSLERQSLKWITPWYADWNDENGWVSRTLQRRLNQYPEKDAWPLIRELAGILASMHGKHVPHGNLKPGNLFFDQEGRIMVSDWCLGNVPGVQLFNFTDALLYQPPEQLLDSSGYLDEQGYGWDVYAFGVIAYRLLTGKFPRCDDVFSKVAPPPEQTRCDGLRADPRKVAGNLKEAPEPGWPHWAANELEERQREWIMRCLAIDPNQRPASMKEVAAGLDAIEVELEQEHRYQQVVKQHKNSKRLVAVLLMVVCGCVLSILSLAGLWRAAEGRLSNREAEIITERTQLTAARDLAEKNEAVVRAAEKALAEELALAAEHYRAQLGAARNVGDRLFAWAMERDRRQLPPLDGREKRLQQLERDLVAFIMEAEKLPELSRELARARLQLAEISISLGRAKLASNRFEVAIAALENEPMDGSLRIRLATDSLLIAKLMEGKASADESMASFVRARKLLADVDATEVGQDRLDQLTAVLQYREAKLLAQQGDQVKALGQLMKATETLNRIASQRSDVALLHSALADCYLSSASILEGIGKAGDAREVRLLAVAELTKMREVNPRDLDVQAKLVDCLSMMAEASFLSGDLEGTDQRAEEALGLLKGYLGQRPRDDDALVTKAALLGLKAAVLRDRGKQDESIERYNEALGLLEAIHKRQPEHAMTCYRLALIWWQKGRMLGISGNEAAEIGLLTKAASLLKSLDQRDDERGPGSEQLLRSRAYLAGDTGHARDVSGDQAAARVSLAEAVELWQQLRKMRPRSEEYEQAEQWCRERLERMK
ncbi:MAG: protein kinase domain-containing protein [Luteolibacter sp.]